MTTKRCEECGAWVWLNIALDAWCNYKQKRKLHECPGLQDGFTPEITEDGHMIQPY